MSKHDLCEWMLRNRYKRMSLIEFVRHAGECEKCQRLMMKTSVGLERYIPDTYDPFQEWTIEDPLEGDEDGEDLSEVRWGDGEGKR